MYLPQHFKETRPEELRRIMAAYPLGAFVTNGPNGLDACHLPFDLRPDAGERGQLRAHVARANPVWQEIQDGDAVLVIFGAPNAYISPNWYPSKHEFHRQVPTWNYQVVHVHGNVHVHDDERFVRGVVARLTRTHEARAGLARPWKMTDSSEDYIDPMLADIVGIEVDITRIVGQWKLSQNKEERDRISAAEELRDRGALPVSEAMLAIGSRE
jgi:transcriptional regulator